MRTWLEYRGMYDISGDKVYEERLETDWPLETWPAATYMELPSEIWLVYGPVVRSYLSEDWSLGGHHYIYPFIRPSEIWLESNLYEEDREPVILKQLISWYLMGQLRIPMPAAEMVATVYSTNLRAERHISGDEVLVSRYPKKREQVLSYAPPTRDRLEAKAKRVNTELEAFLAAREQLNETRPRGMDSVWEEIDRTLDRAEEDYRQALQS